MANVRIIIDGTTAMDSEVSLRTGALPTMDELKGSLQKAAGGEFKPWQLPTVGALSAVLLEGNLKGAIPNTTITVTTRDGGWTLDVQHG
jgi:hypothetical protein